MVVESLFGALKHRAPLLKGLEQEGTTAYRFFCADGDGLPGFVVECFGSVAIFQFHEGKCRLSAAELELAARWCEQHLGIHSVYLKRFVQDRSSASPAESAPHPFWGKPAAAVVPVQENHKTFLIRPFDGLSVGLFLDQRENRKTLGEACRPGMRVLNLFAYTCAFSVYGASQGADVTSVDVSRKYLEWGKANFEANHLSLEGQRFVCEDARDFLKRAAARSERYDCVIVDPPSFARGKKGKTFSVRQDLESVLRQVAAVMAPGASLFVSTNYSKWSQEALDTCMVNALGKMRWIPLPALLKEWTETPALYRWGHPFGSY